MENKVVKNLSSNQGRSASEQAKEFLKQKISEAMARAKSIIGKANKIAKDAQQIHDQGSLFERTIPFIPDSEIEKYIDVWGVTSQQLERADKAVYEIHPVISTASGVAVTRSSDFSDSGAYIFDSSQIDEVTVLSEEYRRFQNIEPEYDTIKELLDFLELNTGLAGEVTPAAQLEIAFQAYAAPVTHGPVPASTSAIPLREAINAILDILIKRRPIQEKVRNQRGKASSILIQIMRADLEKSYIDIMANKWHELNGMLSSTKRKEITREEWRRILFEGLSFLRAFLTALDKDKFKK